MSEATDHPDADDAWARACAEDLAAEKERRRSARSGGTGAGAGAGTGTAAEELFKLFEAVADKVSSLNNPAVGAAGAAAQDAVRQFVNQAKTAAKPVIERNPEVFGHLAAAGSELLAAYRSAVEGHERRWTRDEPPAPRGPSDKGDEGPGTGPAQRIDLD
ncbi:DUF5304 domain-containing protein [Streptomyces katrae]|uniref:DUF5304 domain-containing protein n=1 Tax=Streptomyces katrae TaxID=68223 RepID=A0ABT7H3P6_9ACTN|nr:DUF5304 domain-containing protein [Streptomyces katrae]MDK9500086.1 DUF5304 domain-containing protein [Streptomyces katrae]